MRLSQNRGQLEHLFWKVRLTRSGICFERVRVFKMHRLLTVVFYSRTRTSLAQILAHFTSVLDYWLSLIKKTAMVTGYGSHSERGMALQLILYELGRC